MPQLANYGYTAKASHPLHDAAVVAWTVEQNGVVQQVHETSELALVCRQMTGKMTCLIQSQIQETLKKKN